MTDIGQSINCIARKPAFEGTLCCLDASFLPILSGKLPYFLAFFGARCTKCKVQSTLDSSTHPGSFVSLA